MNEIQPDRTESETVSLFVADLDKNVRTLFLELLELSGAYALLRLLSFRRNSVLTPEDLAYYLRQPMHLVDGNLRRLEQLGWARRFDAIDRSWFGLTEDPQRREIVQELIDCEEHWHRRLNEFQRLVNGNAMPPTVQPWDKPVYPRVDEKT